MSKFSKFIREGTAEEKEEVFNKVIDEAIKAQKFCYCDIDAGGTPCIDRRYCDMKRALEDLVNKLEHCKIQIDNAFFMAYHIRGHDYDGPTYEKELEKARKILRDK